MRVVSVSATVLAISWALLLPALQGQGKTQPTPAQRNVQDSSPQQPLSSTLGPYYALIIGISDYQHINPLQTPIHDADAVASLLRQKYGFQTKVLHNATRNDILGAIWQYRLTLPENSNLLLYYAGHGYRDSVTNVAYWFPVDAARDNNANWISASDISADVSAIPSQHILIVSDSCYSGDLSLSRNTTVSVDPVQRDAFLTKMISRRSRTLLASGGDEPVSDGGADGHSIFAAVFLQTLRDMDQDQFNASDIFVSIQHRVGGRSQQLPQYSSINNSGHDGGDFVFTHHAASDTASAGDADLSRELAETEQAEEINSVVSRYQHAFEEKDMAALRRLWPGMPVRAQKDDTDFFGRATGIKLDVKPLGKPEVSASAAKVLLWQELSFTLDGRPQKVVTPKVTMILSRVLDQRGDGGWQIGSME